MAIDFVGVLGTWLLSRSALTRSSLTLCGFRLWLQSSQECVDLITAGAAVFTAFFLAALA